MYVVTELAKFSTRHSPGHHLMSSCLSDVIDVQKVVHASLPKI